MITKCYISLSDELDLAREELQAIGEAINHLTDLMAGAGGDIKGLSYDSPAVQPPTKIGFSDWIERVAKLKRRQVELCEYIDGLEVNISGVEEVLEKSRGRHHQVVHCIYGLKMTEREVAEKTGYSERHVRRIKNKYSNMS